MRFFGTGIKNTFHLCVIQSSFFFTKFVNSYSYAKKKGTFVEIWEVMSTSNMFLRACSNNSLINDRNGESWFSAYPVYTRKLVAIFYFSLQVMASFLENYYSLRGI